jgi:Ca2+-binding RTX toxin-like protein
LAITATFAVIIGTALTTTNMAWAADITCTRGPVTPNPCTGTNDPDNMKGTSDDDAMSGLDGDDNMNGFARNDQMFGSRGDDTMSGGSGHDIMVGREGNDKVNGDSGNHIIRGGPGADVLIGSSRNDQIYQFEPGSTATQPDGSKDQIDCGSGIDEAWISTVDGDTADSSCETVHTN